MAMEINSKKLHKHALPVLMVAAVVFGVSIIALSQNRVSLTRGLEALLGQDSHAQKINISNIGANTVKEIQSE